MLLIGSIKMLRCVRDEYILFRRTLIQYILPAMIDLKEALQSVLNPQVPVFTRILHPFFLPTSFPPSAAYFVPYALALILHIVQFLQTNRYPLLYAVYSY